MKLLSCYAPGDGALAFCWVNADDGKAEGTPTRKQVERWLATNPDGKRFVEQGYRLVTVNAELRLIGPVRRIDATTLEVRPGDRITVVITPEQKAQWTKQGFVNDASIDMRFTIPDHPELEEMRVRNWSTRAMVRFFIQHEEHLAGQ